MSDQTSSGPTEQGNRRGVLSCPCNFAPSLSGEEWKVKGHYKEANWMGVVGGGRTGKANTISSARLTADPNMTKRPTCEEVPWNYAHTQWLVPHRGVVPPNVNLI